MGHDVRGAVPERIAVFLGTEIYLTNPETSQKNYVELYPSKPDSKYNTYFNLIFQNFSLSNRFTLIIHKFF
jgi:hypothetical protein